MEELALIPAVLELSGDLPFSKIALAKLDTNGTDTPELAPEETAPLELP
jgi:hypothetical protein